MVHVDLHRAMRKHSESERNNPTCSIWLECQREAVAQHRRLQSGPAFVDSATMFWSRGKSSAKPLDSEQILEAKVRDALGTSDEVTVKVVAAIAGLLAAVAYADRKITSEEAKQLRVQLARIHGFPSEHVEAVAQVLSEQALHLSATFVPRFTRTLRTELPEEDRWEVLDALLEMAAVDGAITHDEVASLRNMSTALGLSQDHYNALQEKHRSKLSWRAPGES